MVQPSYLLRKPPRPSTAKILFDQRIVPGAINAAGAVEAGVERIVTFTSRSPMVALATSLIAGAALGWHFGRPKR